MKGLFGLFAILPLVGIGIYILYIPMIIKIMTLFIQIKNLQLLIHQIFF